MGSKLFVLFHQQSQSAARVHTPGRLNLNDHRPRSRAGQLQVERYVHGQKSYKKVQQVARRRVRIIAPARERSCGLTLCAVSVGLIR
jgi:hypothetical protein